jgi:uncharacterized protein YceK
VEIHQESYNIHFYPGACIDVMHTVLSPDSVPPHNAIVDGIFCFISFPFDIAVDTILFPYDFYNYISDSNKSPKTDPPPPPEKHVENEEENLTQPTP